MEKNESDKTLFGFLKPIIAKDKSQRIRSHIKNFISFIQTRDTEEKDEKFSPLVSSTLRILSDRLPEKEMILKRKEWRKNGHSDASGLWIFLAKEEFDIAVEIIKLLFAERGVGNKLSPEEKIAIAMLSIPPEISANIMRKFTQEETESISNAIAGLTKLSPDRRRSVLEEMLLLWHKKKDPLINSLNYSFEKISKKLSNYCIFTHTLSFSPESKEVRILFMNDGAVFIKSEKKKENFSFLLSSPEGKFFKFRLSLKNNCFIRFSFDNYFLASVVLEEKLYVVLFSAGKVEPEEDILLFASKDIFELYSKKIYGHVSLTEYLSEKKEKITLEKLEYIRRNTNLSMEEARKALIENDYDELKTIAKVKSKKFGEKEKIKELTPCYVSEKDLMSIDPVSIEVGRNLLPLLDPKQGARLLNRMSNLRGVIATEMGFMIPGVHFRDNLQLNPDGYVIKIRGIEAASASVNINKFLVIGRESLLSSLEGENCFDPTYGMPAKWISTDLREKENIPGLMAFDVVNVIATHLAEVIISHASSFLTREHTAELIENVSKSYPLLGQEVEKNFSTGDVQKVLENLLKEKVSIRDLGIILDTMCNYAHITKNTDILSEYARNSLSRAICREYQDREGTINCFTIDIKLEKAILKYIEKKNLLSLLNPENKFLKKVIKSIKKQADLMKSKNLTCLILCSPEIRPYLRKLTERQMKDLVILSYNEIVPGVNINIHGMAAIPSIFSVNTIKDLLYKILSPFKNFILKKENNISEKISEKKDYDLFPLETIKGAKEEIESEKCCHEYSSDKEKCKFCGEIFVKESDIEYICCRLDVSRKFVIETLEIHKNLMKALEEIKKKLGIYIFPFTEISEEKVKDSPESESLKKSFKESLKKAEEKIEQAEKLREMNEGYKEDKLQEITLWLQDEVDEKIKILVKKMDLNYYEAFLALYETKGNLKAAIDYLKNGKTEIEKDDMGQLLFAPETWQKLEYIIKSVSCRLGEAFKAFVECKEDEFAAVQLLKEKKKKQE